MRSPNPRQQLASPCSCSTAAMSRKAAPARIAEFLEGRLLMARDLYVDISAPGANTGTSWLNAYRDLQLALADASSGDRILIADGIYKPTATANRTISFALKDGVSLYGGYAGYGATNPDDRNIDLYPTILSGEVSDGPANTLTSITDTDTVSGSSRSVSSQAGGRLGSGWDAINNGNSYHVVVGSNVGRSTLVDGVTITGGRADMGDVPNYSGGGMYLWAASPTLNQVTFMDNLALGTGGGLAAYAASSPLLTGCTFTGNRSAAWGGGLAAVGSPMVLSGTSFTGNISASTGGAADLYRSSVIITGCTFTRNIGYFGGAINSTDGAYSSPSSASVVVDRSSFRGNHSNDSGGAIHQHGANRLSLSNSEFAANYAVRGGAVYANDMTVISGSTFSGNTAHIDSAQIDLPLRDKLTMTNSIVWGGPATPVRAFFSPTKNLVSYSNIQGGFAGVGNTDLDPQFVRTPWVGPDGMFGRRMEYWLSPDPLPVPEGDDFGDLHLRNGSPLLNAGSDAAVPAGLTADLDSHLRIQGNAVAMGAYETPTTPPAARTLYVDVDATGAGDGSSWQNASTSLQSALTAARDGDTIKVAGGTYRPTDTEDRARTFALRSMVTMEGGYAGAGAANPDARDIMANLTILSGDIGAAGDSADNSYNVVSALGIGQATLDGFTITDGRAVPPSAGADPDYGYRHRRGGGLCSLRAAPILKNVTLTGNFGHDGGAMYAGYSSPVLIDTNIIANSCSGSYDGGAGMFNEYSSIALTRCNFVGNVNVNGYGGAMRNSNSTVVATDTSFIRNTATMGSVYFHQKSSFTIVNGLLAGNRTVGSAGLLLAPSLDEAAQLTFTPETTFTAVNSVFVGNGGHVGDSHASTYTNCTFLDPIRFAPVLLYPLTITNTILGPGVTVSTSTTLSYSSIIGGASGLGNISATPLFRRDPSTGADGVWGTADDDYGDLRLQAGSPGIDVGNNAAPGLNGITTDLAGRARIYGGTVDMGAYEFDPPPVVAATAINTGGNQRSTVKQLAVGFNEPVTLAAGAVSVRLRTGAAVPNVTAMLTNPSADGQNYVLAFSGPGTIAGSLPDGVYDLVVTATGVEDTGGNPLTGNFTRRFHCLFGDNNGDGAVNILDYARLRATLGRSAGDALFNSAMDFDGNGQITTIDLSQFRRRFGMRYRY